MLEEIPFKTRVHRAHIMPSFHSNKSTYDPVNRLQSGVKFNVIPETLQSPFKDHFPAYYKGLVRGEPGGFVIHPKFVTNAKKTGL